MNAVVGRAAPRAPSRNLVIGSLSRKIGRLGARGATRPTICFSASGEGPQAISFVEAFGPARFRIGRRWAGRGEGRGLAFTRLLSRSCLALLCRRLGAEGWYWAEVHSGSFACDLRGLRQWRKASVLPRPRHCRSCFRDRCSQLVSACLPEDLRFRIYDLRAFPHRGSDRAPGA